MPLGLVETHERDLVDLPPIRLAAPEQRRVSIWIIGAYLLALLPLLVTLLFLALQLTPWGDPCPPEAPCCFGHHCITQTLEQRKPAPSQTMRVDLHHRGARI